MAETLTHQPFMALNANNQATRVHPAVVRRHVKDAPLKPSQFRRVTGAEPDRSHVELKLVDSPRAVPLPAEPPEPAAVEPEPVAPKKKARRKRQNSSAETKSVAVARVQKLVAAGNQVKVAAATVAKEMGLKPATVLAWDNKERKARGALLPKGGKTRVAQQLAAAKTPKQQKQPIAPRAVNGAGAEGASIGDLLQAIVTATMEIQRRLSQLTL